MYEYDSSLIFMPSSIMQKFLNLNKKIDFFEIYINKFSQIEFYKNEIKLILPDYFRYY